MPEWDYFVGNANGRGLIRIEEAGRHVASMPRGEQSEIDAKRLTTAVNCHTNLLKALKVARKAMTNERYGKPRIGMEDACAVVDAAIAKAEPN
jgi:hypothetical protein